MAPFEPLFRNPHAQTIAGHLWRRPPDDPRFPVERRLIRTAADVQVLVESQWPGKSPKGEIVAVHGLEGSGASPYMRGFSAAALHAGFGVHRFNMRTCGGTERLCQTLYHAGLTSDLVAVLRELKSERRSAGPVFLVGFSLGGNVALKLAGELGASAGDLIRGVCAVSTPLDLEACALRLAARRNRLYEHRFVRLMRARVCATGRYSKSDFAGLRSVMEIDERITAPSFGFENAAHYYRTQSAIRFLDRIRVPVLLIQARDDTFIPFEIFETPAVRGNPHIELLATEHGGHLGFIARRPVPPPAAPLTCDNPPAPPLTRNNPPTTPPTGNPLTRSNPPDSGPTTGNPPATRFWANNAIIEWIIRKSLPEPSVPAGA